MTRGRRLAAIVAIVVAAVFGGGAVYTQVTSAAIARAHPPAGRLIDVDSVRLHVLEQGASHTGAATVVVLHGAGSNLEEVRLALGAALADRRVILIDRPGLGWSDPPGGPQDGRLSRQIALIHDALQRLDAGRVIVVGHSLGGALAARYALTYPGDVDGLVLLAPVTQPWLIGRALSYNIFAAPLVGELLAYTIACPLARLLSGRVLQKVFAPAPVPPGFRERAAVDLALRPRAILENARDLAVLDDFVRAQAPRYGTLTMPVAVIAGTGDRIISSAAHAGAFAAQVPAAALTLLPGIGHMPHHAAPERVSAAIAAMDRARAD